MQLGKLNAKQTNSGVKNWLNQKKKLYKPIMETTSLGVLYPASVLEVKLYSELAFVFI